MTNPLPIKKHVSFNYHGQWLTFDVAQALFSSHQIDRGSRMLLDSLDPAAFPAEGAAVDFGCGYGVLGIAWQSTKSGWSMDYVDRDALAVEFSRHNTAQLDGEIARRARFTCDITVSAPDSGYDLVLWNVPGKAGRPVIAELLDVALDALASGGLVAIVVVHPLADLFTEPLERDDVETGLIERGRDHTVVHFRRIAGEPIRRDPFEEGAFDRTTEMFESDGLEWMLTPVMGLPQYDSLDHATDLAIRAYGEVERDIGRWLVVEPDVGHLAASAFLQWPAARGVLAGRDALALRASHRAVGGVLSIAEQPIWRLPAIRIEEPMDLVIAALPEQAHPEEIGGMLDALMPLVAPDGGAILHGRSTEIARAGAAARKQGGWKLGTVAKLKGSAAVIARRG